MMSTGDHLAFGRCFLIRTNVTKSKDNDLAHCWLQKFLQLISQLIWTQWFSPLLIHGPLVYFIAIELFDSRFETGCKLTAHFFSLLLSLLHLSIQPVYSLP